MLSRGAEAGIREDLLPSSLADGPGGDRRGGRAASSGSTLSDRELLTRLVGRLRGSLGERYERHLEGSARLSVCEGRLCVTVPTGYEADALRKRLGAALRAAIVAEAPSLGEESEPFDIVIDRGMAMPPRSPAPAPAAAPEAAPEPARAPAGKARPATGLPLGRRARLEEFVVGQSNRLAYAAAMRASDAAQAGGAGPGFSSLFIHGSCGLGKTHLLQGLAERYARLNPGRQVRYTTAEAFTNAYISAIRENNLESFRKSYRRLDLLCVDDVHFFANKEATQGELIHTFDAIDLDGAVVALASDEHPRELKKLSDRLVSRFMSGMVVRLEAPEPDLRVKLVAALAERRGLRLDAAGAELLAARSASSIGALGGFGGSVREIEGLVTQVDAVHRLLPELTGPDGRVGIALVRKALGLSERDTPAESSSRPRRPIQVESIASEVCRALRVEMQDFLGTGRHKRVVLARSLTVLLSRRLTTASFPEIARAMGRPNHSTIVTAHQRIVRQIEDDRGTPADLGPQFGPDLTGLTLRTLVDRLSQHVARVAG